MLGLLSYNKAIYLWTLLSELCSESFEKSSRVVRPLKTISKKILQGSTATAPHPVLNNHLSQSMLIFVYSSVIVSIIFRIIWETLIATLHHRAITKKALLKEEHYHSNLADPE